MAYFLLGIVILGLVLLLVAQLQALRARAVRFFALAVLFVIALTAGVIFVASGRYGLAAPAGALALWVMRAYLSARQIRAGSQTGAPSRDETSGPMSRAEALDILGLEEDADVAAIEEAYKQLIKKNHPDQGGTDWIAARLNEARAVLLGD